MRIALCITLTVLTALTNAAFCQKEVDTRIKYVHYENFSPVMEPGAKFEKIAVTARGDAAYVLINNNGMHSVLLYADEPVLEWHSIPSPEAKADVIDISADDLGTLYALYRDASGKMALGYFYDTKWSKKMSAENIDGEITMLMGCDRTSMVVGGNFRVDGHPCHVAEYDIRSKKWKTVFGVDDGLFENTIVKKMTGADMFLKNNNTGKSSLVHYIGEGKWETTAAPPGPVADMLRIDGALYVCGTDEESGKPYLQRWVKGAWEIISLDGADFTKPEMIASAIRDNIYVLGPGKGVPHYVMDEYVTSEKRWEPKKGLPENLKVISYPWLSLNSFLIAEQNGNSAFFREPQIKKPSQQVYMTPILGPPPGTLEDMARTGRKRIAQAQYEKATADLKKVYSSVPEVMEAYKTAFEKGYKSKLPVTMGTSNSVSIDSKELAENLISESHDVIATLLIYYQDKLKAVKIKEEEKTLAAAFEKYLAAFTTKVRDIGDGYESIKNTYAALAREGKSAPSTPINNAGLAHKIGEDIRNLNLAINELNVQWKAYHAKMNGGAEGGNFLFDGKTLF